MVPSSPADMVPRNLRALHGALEHTVAIQATRLQELLDDLVAGGSVSRGEADRLTAQLVAASKAYSHALLQVLDTVTGSGGAPVVLTAARIAQNVRRVVARRAGLGDPPVEPAPPVAPVPLDPAPLTIAEVRSHLPALDAPTLRLLRTREVQGRNRKGLLADIDRRLDDLAAPPG